jgi:DNA-directed RNA polymerase subunit RPC12/RpoP
MTDTQLRCLNCGLEASGESEEWTTATHPTLGSMTQCRECGSTNVHSTL